MQNRQANIEQATGQYAQARRREQLETALGRQRVAMSASGLERSGSLTDIALSSRSEGELDIDAIRFNTDLKSGNLNYQAAVSSANAKSASSAADIAGITTAIGAVAPFVNLAGTQGFQQAVGFGSGAAPVPVNPVASSFTPPGTDRVFSTFNIPMGIPRVKLGLNF